MTGNKKRDIIHTNHTFHTFGIEWEVFYTVENPEGKYAWTVKVGEKGQFVIPKEARDIFGIKPGDTLLVLGDIERGIAIPPKNLLSDINKLIFSPEDKK